MAMHTIRAIPRNFLTDPALYEQTMNSYLWATLTSMVQLLVSTMVTLLFDVSTLSFLTIVVAVPAFSTMPQTSTTVLKGTWDKSVISLNCMQRSGLIRHIYDEMYYMTESKTRAVHPCSQERKECSCRPRKRLEDLHMLGGRLQNNSTLYYLSARNGGTHGVAHQNIYQECLTVLRIPEPQSCSQAKFHSRKRYY